MFTNLSADDLEAFCLLMPRVFSDYRDPGRGKFSIVYNFSQTTDNEDSGFRKLVELARTGVIWQVGICKGSTENGYAGYEHSIERLVACGFDRSRVPVVPVSVDGNLNTGSEAEALVRYGVNLSGDIGIIAPAFHLMRAFMTTVSAMYRLEKIRRVYAIVGASIPWTENVRHSQGTLIRTREQLVLEELKRLKKYRAPEFGGMVRAQKMFEYLDWRDSSASQ